MMPYSKALARAEKIAEALTPFAAEGKIMIAGSIRRQREQIGDIDLVILPADVAGLKARCRQTCTVVSDGRENFSLNMRDGFRVDIYLARPAGMDFFQPIPSNWGSLVLCRTGSAAHNIHMAQLAQAKGFHWAVYDALYDADFRPIAAEREEDFFTALGLDWIPPEARER